MAAGTPASADRGLAVSLLSRPDLWLVALGTALSLVPRRWWARVPFLPVPDRAWLEFRLETAYGDPHAKLVAEDVISYLEWRRSQRVGALRARTRTAR